MRRSTAIFTLKRERVPLVFQAGHAGSIPVTRSTRKPYTVRVFTRSRPSAAAETWAMGPSGAVCTTPVPRRHERDRSGKLATPVRSEHPLHRKPLHSKGFHAPKASACFRNVDHGSLARTYYHTATPGPARWAGATARPKDNPAARSDPPDCHACTTTPTARDFMTTALAHRKWRSIRSPRCASCARRCNAGLDLARSQCSVAGGAVLLDNRGRDPTVCGDLVVVGDRLRTNRRSVGLGRHLTIRSAATVSRGGEPPASLSVGPEDRAQQAR